MGPTWGQNGAMTMKTTRPAPEKINLRLPPALKQALQAYADAAGISVNSACVLAIQNYLPFARRSVAPLEKSAPAVPPVPSPAVLAKVGRNAPCPCGSGKKSKHCHGSG